MTAQFPLTVTDSTGEPIATAWNPTLAETIARGAGPGSGILLFGRVVWSVPSDVTERSTTFGAGETAVADAMADQMRLSHQIAELEALMRERFPDVDIRNRGDRGAVGYCVHAVDLRDRCPECEARFGSPRLVGLEVPAGYVTGADVDRLAEDLSMTEAIAAVGSMPLYHAGRHPLPPAARAALDRSGVAPAEAAGEFRGLRHCVACGDPFIPGYSSDGRHCPNCYAGELGDAPHAGAGMVDGAFDAEFGPKN